MLMGMPITAAILADPIRGADVHKQGNGMRHVGDVKFSNTTGQVPDQPGVGVVEERRRACALACALNIVQDPPILGPEKR